jgi:hypothetical protein
MQDEAMNTTRRLAASALPMLLIAGATRAAFAKRGEPLAAEACGPDADVKGCATGKGAEGGCPHCAALAGKDKR